MKNKGFRLRESMLRYASTREPSSSYQHMGRSEAPLSRDRKKETSGEANRKQLLVLVSKILSSGDYTEISR